MIIDANLVFDSAAYVAGTGLTGIAQFASGATTTSTNVIDLQQGRDIGDANSFANLTVVFMITTAYVGGTSVNFQIQGSTDNVTYVTFAETGAIAIASLTVGARYSLQMPSVNPDVGPPPRYLRTAYVNLGANTAGSVLTWLGSVDDNRYYKPGIVISN
jgi:hypothetical protein